MCTATMTLLYKKTPPESCICVEDTIYEYGGVRVLGLGGSIRYKQGPFQYTQQEMERRRKRLWLSRCGATVGLTFC